MGLAPPPLPARGPRAPPRGAARRGGARAEEGAGAPRGRPAPATAPTPEMPGAVQAADLGDRGPRPADRAVAVGPGPGRQIRPAAAAGLEQPHGAQGSQSAAHSVTAAPPLDPAV